MITDILGKGTELLAVGDRAAWSAHSTNAARRRVELPGVMSRKKQVAPRLLEAASR